MRLPLRVQLTGAAYSARTPRPRSSGCGRGTCPDPDIAIQNARLFSQEQEREAYLSGLLEINKKIGALAPTDALLTFIAEEAARLLDVDNAGFRLRDGDDLVVAGLAGMARETMRRPRLQIGESLSGRALLEGQILIADVATATDLIPEHREADLRLGYVQVLLVPLRVGERTIGVLKLPASACRPCAPGGGIGASAQPARG